MDNLHCMIPTLNSVKLPQLQPHIGKKRKLLTSTVLCSSEELDYNPHPSVLFYTGPNQSEIMKWRIATGLNYS